MAYNERSLDDYVDVAQRIADFREQYPHGSLQPVDTLLPWEQASVTGYDKNGEPVTQTFIVYKAAAYRTPDDERPGIGVAWEIWPGRTPYTRGSELMNAETSAWGRAIVAVLASDSKRGIASRQEVQARRLERDEGHNQTCGCSHPKSHHIPDTEPPGCKQCDCTFMWNADGSLSRSRTTDEQKAAAGVMTSAQQAEHTALQPKQAEVRGKVERAVGAPGGPIHTFEDPWAAEPGDVVPVPPEERPGTLTTGQQKTIMAAFPRTMERAERLAYISALAGRDVGSTNELSYAEAQKVVAGLGREPVKAK